MALSKSGGLDNSQTSPFSAQLSTLWHTSYLQTTLLSTSKKDRKDEKRFLNQCVPALNVLFKVKMKFLFLQILPVHWWWSHNNNYCKGTVSTSTDWVGVLSILDFLELGGGFLQLPGWHHRKRAGIKDALVVEHLTNREEQLHEFLGFLTYWFIGWPVLWYLISCVMQIKWYRSLLKQFISKTPQTTPSTSSVFIEIRPYTSIQPL